ncbi:hypothetical protein A5659_04300 [Mycobacterium sp. 1165196.3]|nr:hypothetical protein A5659_04300 [Mycobacterium sp. 1165196.3]
MRCNGFRCEIAGDLFDFLDAAHERAQPPDVSPALVEQDVHEREKQQCVCARPNPVVLVGLISGLSAIGINDDYSPTTTPHVPKPGLHARRR